MISQNSFFTASSTKYMTVGSARGVSLDPDTFEDSVREFANRHSLAYEIRWPTVAVLAVPVSKKRKIRKFLRAHPQLGIQDAWGKD